MFQVLDENNNIVTALGTKKEACNSGKYFCKFCGAPMRYKRGFVRHQNGENVTVRPHFFVLDKHLDSYCDVQEQFESNVQREYVAHSMSEWHKSWQAEFPEGSREVHMRTDTDYHIADVYLEEQKIVIEFQHSPIEENVFTKRTRFYIENGYRVIWIFDGHTNTYEQVMPFIFRTDAYVFTDYGRVYFDSLDDRVKVSYSRKEFVGICYDIAAHDFNVCKSIENYEAKRKVIEKQREESRRQKIRDAEQKEQERKQIEEKRRLQEIDDRKLHIRNMLERFGISVSDCAFDEFISNNSSILSPSFLKMYGDDIVLKKWQAQMMSNI